MKKHHALLVTTLFLSVSAMPSLHAQPGFNAKKKTITSVNTSSLRARSLRQGALKSTTPGRSLPHARSFQQPLLTQRFPNVVYSRETGLPSFITSTRNTSAGRLGAISDIRQACTAYVQELKPQLGITRSDVDFSVRNTNSDQFNKTRVRMDQRYKGIPVYGADVVVHLNASGEGESFNGTYYNIKEDIDVVPRVTEQAAVEKVNSQLAGRMPLRPLSEQERKWVQYEQPHVTLCIYRDKKLVTTFLLAYHIISCPSIQQRWEHFVDAVTGNVLHQVQTTCYVDGPRTATGLDLNGASQSLSTYQVGSTFFLVDTSRPMYNAAASVLPDSPVGAIFTINQNNTFGTSASFLHVTSANNAWSNATGVSAHFNAGVAYEYYRTTFSRNSIDGNGGTIYSMINVPNETGQALDNAYWNGKVMSYGNGDVAFKPLAGALDVGGHEMTHGVVQNTANLEYQGESGAINESMADIFGCMMDPADWLIGEDIVKLTAFPSGALRSLSDPHNGGTSLASPGFQPSHTNEAYTGTEDNGGVHINSGIPNNAFYRFAQATTSAKAAAVFYKALDAYLTKSSKFIDLRLAVIKAAGDLYGPASAEVTQAGIAFDAVGISDGTGGNYTDVLSDNPGTEFLLVYNTDGTDPNTLYRTPADASSFAALSTTALASRPSITDDGTIAVFVGSDHMIHAINTATGGAPGEIIIQGTPIWSNVVVSKGGTKLAAVTIAQDTAIFVYDFSSENWQQFKLYNPTFSQGVNSGGPVYADALEWDFSGEVLVYDCFNRIKNNAGVDIEYWDVNFIRVWDNSTHDFSDGTIAKLFSSLPEGVSIGNPSFSKNSPNIIAFDYVNSVVPEYALYGSNIETSDVNVIASITSLGYPTYNKNDSRIGFTSLNAAQHNIDYILLNADKISANGAPIGFISNAKWPVYFATGNRVIGESCIPPKPVIAVTNMNSSSPTLTSSSSAGNQWYFNGTAINGATGQTLTVTESGVYKVRVVLNGCASEFSAGQNLTVTGIAETAQRHIAVYPNPVSEWLTVTLEDVPVKKEVVIYQMDGRRKSSQEVFAAEARFNVGDYSRGIYIVKIVMGNSVTVRRFAKE